MTKKLKELNNKESLDLLLTYGDYVQDWVIDWQGEGDMFPLTIAEFYKDEYQTILNNMEQLNIPETNQFIITATNDEDDVMGEIVKFKTLADFIDWLHLTARIEDINNYTFEEVE